MPITLGNDISKWQGDINFDVFEDNANFVIVKVSEGIGFTDPKFKRNQSEARRVGLLLGYYHFARPDLGNSPEKEADYFLSVVGEAKENELYALDYECADQKQSDVDWCKKFLDRIQSKIGVKPFIYLNQSQVKKFDWQNVINGSYALWIAAYTKDPNKNDFVLGKFPSAAMQQWTNEQKVPGISGNVDGNVFFGSLATLKKYGYHQSSMSIPTPQEPSSPIPAPQNTDLDTEKRINELSKKVVDNTNSVNTLNDKVDDVLRKINDIQNDVTTIYKDRDTLAVIQAKLTENTNSINNVNVANTKSTTELKGEIRASKEFLQGEMDKIENRVEVLENKNEIEQINKGKYAFIKRLFGKYFLVKVK